MTQHVQALGAVVHGVGGDVRENRAARELMRLSLAGARDAFVEGTAMSFGDESLRVGFKNLEQFIGGATDLVLIDARAKLLLGERLRPGAHGGQHVSCGVVERAGADVEALMELFGG